MTHGPWHRQNTLDIKNDDIYKATGSYFYIRFPGLKLNNNNIKCDIKHKVNPYTITKYYIKTIQILKC